MTTSFFQSFHFDDHMIERKLQFLANQTGFGWTNGVVIDFLVTFGDELMDDDDTDEFLEIEADEKTGSQEDLPLLNTQFNIEDGKSKIVKTSKWGALSKAIMATRWVLCQRVFLILAKPAE